MDNTTVNVVLDKKIDKYNFEENNFVAPQEITVTITLAEYRELIKAKAKADVEIGKANADKYSRDNENIKLRNENNELRARLYALEHSGEDEE